MQARISLTPHVRLGTCALATSVADTDYLPARYDDAPDYAVFLVQSATVRRWLAVETKGAQEPSLTTCMHACSGVLVAQYRGRGSC